MINNKQPNIKKVERIVILCFCILALGIGLLIYFVKQEDKKFLEEGVKVEATINGLYESGTQKNKQHTMKISIFTKGIEQKTEKIDTVGKTENQNKIDAILDKIKIGTICNYVSVTINCSTDSYNNYNVGDKIEVVYLKEDSTDIRIVNELE